MSFLSVTARRVFASSARRVFLAPLAARPATTLQSQGFHSKKVILNSKKPEEKPQSILTDDLLAKAGFDENPEQSKNGEQQQQPKKDRKRRSNKTSSDVKREKYANFFYLGLFGCAGLGIAYLARNWDEKEREALLKAHKTIDDDGYTPQLMYSRLIKRFKGVSSVLTDPISDKLLPDMPKDDTRLTLVVSLEDLFIHSEWDSKHGWRVAKRPGMDYFLLYLASYYEVVLFSDNFSAFVDRTIQKLDPHDYLFAYKLTKEAARLQDGKIIKDLSLLNRDLNKVLILDPNPEHYQLQQENALPILPWNGQSDEKLVEYIPFLEWLAYLSAVNNLKDVRPILATFKNKYEIPEEFAKREQLLRKDWLEKHGTKSNGNGSFLMKLLGLNTVSRPGSAVVSSGEKMPLDSIKEFGQENYKRILKIIDENLKMEEKRKEELAGQKVNLTSLVTEGNPQEKLMREQLEREQKFAQQQQEQQQKK